MDIWPAAAVERDVTEPVADCVSVAVVVGEAATNVDLGGVLDKRGKLEFFSNIRRGAVR